MSEPQPTRNVQPEQAGFSYSPWIPPFKYNQDGTWIEDSKGHRLLDVRGWGFLTGRGEGGLKIDRDIAAEIQDDMAKRVLLLVNRDALPVSSASTKPTVATTEKKTSDIKPEDWSVLDHFVGGGVETKTDQDLG